MSKEEALELFKPGDFLERGDDWIFIFAGLEERDHNFNVIRYYALLSKTTGYYVLNTSTGIGAIENYTNEVVKHASNKCKQKLLDCIKNHGLIWNEEEMKLEPIFKEEEIALPF